MTDQLLHRLADWLAPSKCTEIGADGVYEVKERLESGDIHRVQFEHLPKNSLFLNLEDSKRGIFTFWNDSDRSTCPFRKMCDGIVLLFYKERFYVVYVELKSGYTDGVAAQFTSARAAWLYLAECLRLQDIVVPKYKERYLLCTKRRLMKKNRSTRTTMKVEGVTVTKTDAEVVNLPAFLGY
jgi:hypothetical protein